MKDIKTRDSVQTRTSHGRDLTVAAAMKKAYIKTREQAEETVNSENESAESYALGEAQANAEEVVAASADTARTGAGKAIREARERIRTRKKASEQIDEVVSPTANGSAPTPSARCGSPVVYEQAATATDNSRRAGAIKTREYVRQSQTKTDSAGISVKRTSDVIKATERRAAAKRSRTAAVKTAQKTQAAATKAANDSRKAAQFARQTADKAKKAAKASYRALKAAIKGAIAGVKSLVAAIAAGGWVAVVIIIIVCLAGLIAASAFGIFTGNDVSGATDGDTSRDLRSAVSTINSEYYEKIQTIRNGVENLDKTTITINGEIGAMTGVWQDVLAVYAVDTAHGTNATLAIDFDSSKTQRLREIFWSMVSMSYRVTERVVEEEQEVTDEYGNATTELVEVTYHDVKVYVTTKSAAQAAALYSFSDEQNRILVELMSDQFTKSWSDLIYGYSYGDEDIVAVAISQIGNIGGEPYWRWYGLSSRTEWCAIFVSWCADQCGYIDAGVIPKFAWVPDAVSWFQARGQWQPGGYTPMPGDIIFFDWESDGGANHVGIVEYCENSVVHTVEGNSGDACKRRQYGVGDRKIMGYGLPIYSS